jgi:uncharacterized repeat protein (TIGR02543 family)
MSSGWYSTNSTQTMSASPSTGYTFAGWSGNCSGTGNCSVSMTQNRSVTASFTAWSFASVAAVNPGAGESYVYGSYSPSGSYSFVPYGGWPGDIYPLKCDWNGDGRNDLITGVGAGGGPHIQVFSANGGGGHSTQASKHVAQCDASYCYTGGAWPIHCYGNRWIQIRFGNGVVQDHYF